MKFHPSTVQSSTASPLGPMLLAASDAGLAGVWFHDQKHLPNSTAWPVQAQHPVLLRAAKQLQEYFAGQRQVFDLPLDLRGGTAFQQSVWQALLQITPGDTTSYGVLSTRIHKPLAVRAVGAAVGRNPLSVIVPCHRVLGADGSLTGYAAGLPRKQALLQLEQAQFTQ
ncbi:methylated-DNA--[protein]-cysteine S-methyltransferase [Rhodoferax saidenbachensis]|uniref:Methylated-DNA--protein-cysteine methyltransferase n=1 Tax=Rhodoferax saidenbachensis TaxID=1484693 RepID=A0A1P8K7Q3_9BURK|nr:methylated-DNA--[protein]-cysteine S-methyltransferase [Rhodoferax saidenbachensis]APW42037.1 cysteine methyltransferase [Rhodoferax saidenbachensis]